MFDVASMATPITWEKYWEAKLSGSANLLVSLSFDCANAAVEPQSTTSEENKNFFIMFVLSLGKALALKLTPLRAYCQLFKAMDFQNVIQM